MQFKFSQGIVPTVCRQSGQVNNCCIATYFSKLCAKYYKNCLICVKKYSEIKRCAFLEHGVYLPMFAVSVTNAPNDPGSALLSAVAHAVYAACRVLGVIQCSLLQMPLLELDAHIFVSRLLTYVV